MIFRIIFFILILISVHARSQYIADVSVEGGTNYVSSGFYTDVTGQFSANIYEWQIATAAGISFSNASENFFNAMKLDVSRDFRINEIPLTGHVFYQWRPFSEILHEHNAGIIFKYLKNKFGYHLGINTRFFKLTNKYASSNNYDNLSI